MIPKSTFSTLFAQYNDFHKYGFKEWVFYPGMLFQHLHTWWSNGAVRPTPHEGIDICFFRDETGQVRRLGGNTKVPVMYDGEIIHIHDDFLGESVYVKHNINDNRGNVLYTIYGHTVPVKHHDVGGTVCEGDFIATVSATTKNRKVLPHVHITMAWLPESFSCKKLNWETISNPHLAILCNPLEFVDFKYTIEEMNK